MKVQVIARRFEMDEAIHEYTRCCLTHALDHRQDRIAGATVAMEDLNGPRGVSDLRCRVTVLLSPRGRVHAEATGPLLVPTIDRAVQRAARQVDRFLESSWGSRRRLSRRRQSCAA